MLARWIATVAALLLACAQAGAHVRSERVGELVNHAEHDRIERAAAPASPAENTCNPEAARPARAKPADLASGHNAAPSHCHDWQKSVARTDCASGNTIWRWDSAPFGDTPANEQPTVGLPSFTYNLRFPGQQYDRETGTHYNYFRDYEARTGRYVQSDPVGLDAGSLSAFPYADNHPTGAFDEFGLAAVRRYKGCNIYGSPQRTRGANGARHAADSMKEARAKAQAAAKAGKSIDIHLNRPLDSSVGKGGKERPDLLTHDPTTGEIDMCEICSPKQDIPGQLAKQASMRAKMGSPPGKDDAKKR